MSITSFNFLLLVAVGIIAYYGIPKKLQWMVLFLLSIIFYCCAANPYTIGYLITSTLVAYVSTIWMDHIRKNKGKETRGLLILTIVALAINIAIWFVVKAGELWIPVLSKIGTWYHSQTLNRLVNMQFIASLGMGYYTLQILGYIIDCYWKNVIPQKNPVKLFLFTAYFPQLTTGPISRYSKLQCLYEQHKFDYQNLAFGAQRVAWGFFKKLVLAERVGIFLSTINANAGFYVGFYSWIVILLYPLQMYADFSGCMDIVLGISEMFGIKLDENFNNPFFARNSQEFWQRWHITLGTWAKDYVLYPLLKSRTMVNFGKAMKKKYGKKASKFGVNFVGMFVLWMVMGIWHGGWKYIVGVSLWYWIILMAGDLFSPLFEKFTTKFEMKTESFSWHLFQSMRTYLIYAVGASFFSLGIDGALYRLQDAANVIFKKDYANPWIFFDGSVLNLGLNSRDFSIIIVAVVAMLIVGILREKHGYARLWIHKQGFVFRWMIWLALIIFVMICGKYGPGYNAADFIYQGF